jgi:polyisoprenoid-binding protein YceI
MMPKIMFTYVFLFILLSICVSAEYHVDKSKTNLVRFISDAPLEDFEGVTENIDGYLYWEGEDTLGTNEIYFEVDLNTVDTGIGLRNRHMRENYLHTDEYPKTYFKGKLTKISSMQNDMQKVIANGVMFIHGIEQKKSVEAQLIPQEQGYKIITKFIVALPDYDIEVPQLMFMKINEDIQLELEFYLKKIEEQG